MASWILLLLLFCCGKHGMSDCDCRSDRDRRDGCDSDRDGRDGCDLNRDRRDNDCNRRTERRNETRLEPRAFASFSGSTCGCEDTRNSNDCDCGQ